MVVVVGIQLSWAVGHQADRPHRGRDTESRSSFQSGLSCHQKTSIVIVLIGW